MGAGTRVEFEGDDSLTWKQEMGLVPMPDLRPPLPGGVKYIDQAMVRDLVDFKIWFWPGGEGGGNDDLMMEIAPGVVPEVIQPLDGVCYVVFKSRQPGTHRSWQLSLVSDGHVEPILPKSAKVAKKRAVLRGRGKEIIPGSGVALEKTFVPKDSDRAFGMILWATAQAGDVVLRLENGRQFDDVLIPLVWG